MCDTVKRPALALGYFDGLHIAHQKVLSAALKQKNNGLTPSVLLFDRRPVSVLSGKDVPRLMTEADRDALLSRMGLAPVRLCFADIKDLSPESFVRDILVGELNCAFVSCGYNFRFGKGGEGTASMLRRLCAENGVAVTVCRQVTLDGVPVSSSAIRAALAAGETEKANAMLGRPLSFSAPVWAGDRRGRDLGAPTINQTLPEGFITPALGVYASVVTVDGVRYPSVTNVGARPTFGGEAVRSETYIIGFTGDLYGRDVRVELVSFLRKEHKFPSFEALKAQIARDAEAAERTVRTSVYFQK